ncbi:hypothetical protein KUTeg_023228, partial [Tegillarca granosa]
IYSSGGTKDKDRFGKQILVVPLWRNQAWFPSLLQNASTSSHLQKGSHPLVKENAVNRMSCIRQSLQNTGISKQASEYICSSWKVSTCKQYDLAWNKWSSWCRRFKINPTKPSEAQIINYLSLLSNFRSYSVVNIHKCSIVQSLAAMGSNKFVISILLSRFLKGLWYRKTTRPRYSVTWDVCLLALTTA